jgi:hypothetical protein
LRSKLNFSFFTTAVYGLAESEVKNLDDSFMKDNVAGFQIIMNNLIFESVKIVKGTKDLLDI